MSILDVLDKAAETLLEKALAGTPSTGDAASGVAQASLVDQIKAFEAVARWARERETLVPKEREPGRGELIRQQFNGTTRRGRSRSEETAA